MDTTDTRAALDAAILEIEHAASDLDPSAPVTPAWRRVQRALDAIDRAITAHVEAEVARALEAAPEVEAAIGSVTCRRCDHDDPLGDSVSDALRAAIAADKARAVEAAEDAAFIRGRDAMSDDITTRIAQLTIIDPPSGWVDRAVNRFEENTMNTASPSHLVAYKVHTFDALLRDAEVYDALESDGPRADARAARLGAARIVGTAIRFDGADAATAEQAEEVITRALLIARDREPDDGAWMAAMFAQMRDNHGNHGTAEIAATMIEAIAVRESYGLPCVEWRAALDVMRAILDPGAVPWVTVGQ